MATLAAARIAKTDLDAWLLSLPAKRRITPDDVQRLNHALHLLGAGLDVVKKYLILMHKQGWEAE